MLGAPVVLTVTVHNDQIPGTFHTLESVVETVQRILNESIGHYGPNVVLDVQASIKANLEADA